MKRISALSSCAVVASMAGVVTLAHGQGRSPTVRAPRGAASAGAASPVTPAVAAPGAAGSFPTAVPAAPPPPAAPFRPTSDATSAPTTTEAAAQFRAPNGGVTIGLQEADLPDLVNWIGGLTGKRFIYGSKMKSLKVTLYSPTPVTVAEAYRAFLVALETNGLTVVPHGRFLKIIETQGVSTETTPVYGTAQPVPAEDRYVTRLYRLQHVGADEVSQVLTKFKSKEGEIVPYGGGNLLIITDTGSNIRRMLQLVEEIDVGSSGEQIWVEPVHYVTPSELAARLNDLFDIKAGGGAPAPAPGRGGNQPASVSGSGGGGSGEGRVTKIVPDDRSKALVIVASERAYLRMLEVIKRVDVPPTTGDGDIHVMALQHAMAEELAPVLNQILGGAGGAIPGAPGAPRPPGAPPVPTPTPGVGGVGGQVPLGIFEGVVRITADKATNSVIITSSLRDYAQIRNVIDKLDQPRRQVFIEAVVMDVSISDSDRLSVSYHGGALQKIASDGDSLIYGGLNPLNTLALPPPPDQLQGFALGVRGPGLGNSTNLLGTGVSIPAFGVLLNALATSSNANVLATPHIIATDNTPAEINVGQNIPLQTNSGGFGNLAGLAGAAGGQAGALGALGGLGGLGGFGGFGAAPRTDVGTKIKVTPHMNDSNEVRLELQEEISEQGTSPSGTLGAVSINKRTANTSVVVKDQQTVVIGGLVRDAYTNTVDKVPLLGDIPVLGVLFRKTQNIKAKSNLLLILTPYVVRDQQDLRAVFERKMQERQEFLDRYFVFADQRPYEVPKDFSRLNGLLEDIRQANLSNDERRRLSDATKPRDRKTHEPTTPIEMPDIVRPSGGAGTTVQAPAEGGGRGGARRGGETAPAGGQANSPNRTGPAVLTPGSRGAPTPRRE